MSVGVIHARVADDRHPVRFGEVADPHQRRDAACPLDIGLQNIDKPVACGSGKGMDGVPVFARGEDLFGHALAHLHVALHILGQHVILEPLEAIRFQGFHEAHGVFHIERHPRIEHELDIIADLRARLGDEVFGLADALNAGFRAVSRKELHGLEPQFEKPSDAVLRAVGKVRVAGIAKNFVFLRPT